LLRVPRCTSGSKDVHSPEAENERLLAQHSEDHLRSRQATYHEFLNSERRFENLVGRGEATAEDFLKFNDVANGVALFGMKPVTTLAAALVSEYGAVFEAAQAAQPGAAPGTPQEIIAAYEARKDTITRARLALVDAMRADVAPGGEPNA
jgi:hypothetical protein